MDLRSVLMNDNFESAQEILSQLKNTKENYNEVCKTYTEFEVKNIVLDQKIVQLIIDFVVEYRLKYSNENEIPKKNEDKLSERLSFLKEIVDDYLKGKYENPIEEIELLKCIAKTLKQVRVHKSKVPWHNVHFLICCFVAVKSFRKRDQFKFIDDFFQLLLHEDLIRDVLQLLLDCLKKNPSVNNKWTKFNNTYSILQIYYLLLKSAHYYNFINKDLVVTDKISNRALQVIGECCNQINKVQYTGFNGNYYPVSEVTFFSNVLSHERNKLSHFKELLTQKQKKILSDTEESTELLNIEKLGFFILDMIQIVRIELEKIIVEDYRNLIENGNVEKIFNRVNYMNLQEVLCPIKNIKTPSDYMVKELEVLSECGLIDNLRKILLTEKIEYIKKSYRIGFDDQKPNIISFIQWFKTNYQKPLDCIKNKLNAIPSKQFIGVKTLMRFFLELVPESEKERNMKWFEKCKQTQNSFVTNPDLSFSRDEAIIDEFLEKIRRFICKSEEKEKFIELEDILLKKRSLKLEWQISGKANGIIKDWPKDKQDITEDDIKNYNDPLNSFLDKAKTNTTDHENISIFLESINWENREQIVDKIKADYIRELKMCLETICCNCGENEIVDEINLLNCLEILKKMDIESTYDFNYLDFDCSIPVARNLRNCLAHGDIYVDIFCPNLNEIIQSHLKIISKMVSENNKDFKQIGFCQSDNFEIVKKDLERNQKWAKTTWETLNFNKNLDKTEEIETFKVRDHNNQSVVHYNLKNVNQDKSFLRYLIDKVKGQPTFQSNELFEKMFNESKHRSNSKNYTMKFLTDKFLNAPKQKDQLEFLCLICISCDYLDLFREVYSEEFGPTKFLCNAIAYNRIEISNFLLNYIKKWSPQCIQILKLAIKSNDKCLILSSLNTISNISSQNLKKNLPSLVILAAQIGNTQILDLLLTYIGEFNSETRYLLIKTVINFNLDSGICEFIFKKYLSPISRDESELILHVCCFNERYEILKYLLERVVPQNHWNEIRKSILASCYNMSSKEIVKYLIDQGAFFDYKSFHKFTPFFRSSEIVEILFESFDILKDNQRSEKLPYVANKNVAEVFLNRGYTLDWNEIDLLPMEFELTGNPDKLIIIVRLDRVKHFLRRGSYDNKFFIKFFEEEPLPFSELPDIGVGRLREKQWISQINWKEPNEYEFLHIIYDAILKQYHTYVRIALKKFVNPNAIEGFDKLVFLAVIFKQDRILKLFHEFGADLNTTYDGLTLLDKAIQGKGTVTDSMRILSKCGVKCQYNIDFYNLKPQDLLRFGVLEGNTVIFQNALELGANINFKYKEYRFGTVLHIAAYHIEMSESKLVESIVKLGIDTSIRDIDNCTAFDLNDIYGPTVKISKDISSFNLYWAGVLRNDIDLMEEALNNGADVNSTFPGLENDTSLHILANKGSLKSVKFLLNKGANSLKTNYRGKYPLDESILRDRVDVFNILFAANSDLNNYFEKAVKAKSPKIVKL